MDSSDILSLLVQRVLTVICLLYIFYRYATSTHNHFSDQGIPGPKPIPFFGNVWGIWKVNLSQYDVALVKQYGKVFGYFEGLKPNLWIADTDMIKAVCVKDFDHFTDRRKAKVLRKWLIMIKGQEWRDVRLSVTPAFTLSKIKRMSVLIKACVGNLCDRVATLTEKDGKIDAKMTFSAFSMDVIARCAFGLKIDNLGNKDDSFVKNANFFFNLPAFKTILMALLLMYPDLVSYFVEGLFVTKELTFFFDLLANILQERSQSQEKFNDFIELTEEAVSDCIKEVDGKTVPVWSREEIDELVIGQSTVFMLAAFDTTSTTLTSTCYLLAKHPDIQEKLYESIVAKMDEGYDEVCQQMVQNMPYLEMVIQEVLRFYPPIIRVERQCTKDYSYDNGRIKIKKGQFVTIPILALHHMEEYYPDPEKFDPERWSPENKGKRSPYAFLAFGIGPRNCIGMRFAMEELKLALCSLVQKFRFFPIEETPERLQFDNGFTPLMQPIHTVVGTEFRQCHSN